MTIRTTLTAFVLAFCLSTSGLFAQEEEESDVLTVGSVAPSLDIEHWVQDGDGEFKPVTEFEEGKVYLVEFWATWCGPCIASMPHLSETQEKFADQGFQIISVSDEDLETVEEFLEKSVRGDEDITYKQLTANYCLTTDPDESVKDAYMRAAGQNGIPTAFIVGKTGHIEWIGHPMDKMDKTVEQVLSDEWDRDAFAVKFKASQEMDVLLSKLGRKMQQGKTDEVIADLTEAIENSESDEVIARLSSIRTQVMITSGAEGAADALRELAESSENANQLNNLAWAIVELQQGGDEVSDELIAAAAAAAERGMELEPEAGHIVDTLAHLVHMQGDLDRAIELTEKAVELSGDEFPEIKDFLKQLKEEKEGKKDDDKESDDK